MKKLILFCLLLCFGGILRAQLPVGEWQAHMAYGSTSMSVFFGDKVYALSSGSLFSYDPEDGDIVTYDLVHTLSDVEILHIALCKSEKKLLLVYSNGNIDLMDEQGNIYNITDLKNSSLADKRVNGVGMEGSRAYLATNTGVIVLDIRQQTIAANYTLNKQVTACVVINGCLLAAVSGDGLYRGYLSDNLLDISKWTKIHTDSFTHLISHKNVLYGNILGKALLKLNPETGESVRLLDGTYNYFFQVDGRLAAGRANNKLYLFESPEDYDIIDIPAGVVDIVYGNSIYWVSHTHDGLAGYTLEGNTLVQHIAPLTLNAPKRNLFYRMFMHKNKLYTCGGGIYLDRYYNPGTIQVMDENGLWSVYQEDGIMQQTGKSRYGDITSIAVDPDDDGHLFAASAGEGLYEFQDGKFVKLHTPDNSTISSDYRYPNIVRVDGLCYDGQKNLWALCAGATNIISVYTHEKKWISLYHQEISQVETFRRTFFDRRGWMWFLTPNYTKSGLVVLDHKGTVADTSDDRIAYLSELKNQDGDRVENAEVTCAVEEADGAIWVGSNQGLLVIPTPATLFDEGDAFHFTQIKVPRNDGTNYADYLMDGVSISDIAIDGANRKWIGTESSGIYLLSADGLEQIAHFTTENSPLLSDEIQSIAVNKETGLVYIGTSKGLVAYQSEATQAQTSFSASSVRAYPNPVRPDYTGIVSIVGLMMNSQVKITDAYGSLVHEGISVGGSFSWDGRNAQGKRVASGVYHVMATDEEGEEGVVTKIVFIK